MRWSRRFSTSANPHAESSSPAPLAPTRETYSPTAKPKGSSRGMRSGSVSSIVSTSTCGVFSTFHSTKESRIDSSAARAPSIAGPRLTRA